MCLSADEITREAACQGQAAAVSFVSQYFLLRVWGREGSGGRQQDALGEKWHGGSAVSLWQDHQAGQVQVGSGFLESQGLINY